MRSIVGPMADGHIPSSAQLAVSGQPTGHAHVHTGGAVLDRLGVGVSLGCAIHCIAAGVLSALPGAALGIQSEWLERLEWPFLLGAAVIGTSSLLPAYRGHHSKLPLAIFGAGVSLLVASRFLGGPVEIGVTIAAVTAIASAHLVNLRLCH